MISTVQLVRFASLTSVLVALVAGSLALGGCGKRRVFREEPEEPIPAQVSFGSARHLANATLPPALPPALASALPAALPPTKPFREDAERTLEERRVRDAIGETLAHDLIEARERAAREQRERDARRKLERAREEAARRKLQELETGTLVTKRARKELTQHAKSLGLTIVEERLLVVKFAVDLRSGTVRYWMALNDTGLLGADTATIIWRGKLTWERDEKDEIVVSRPKPTTGKPGDPSEKEPTDTPEDPPEITSPDRS